MKKITDRIFYVGVNDFDKIMFEGLWPLPSGVSYNSYIIADEKVALIDTVEHGFEADFLENIQDYFEQKNYVIHMRTDENTVFISAGGQRITLNLNEKDKAIESLALYISDPFTKELRNDIFSQYQLWGLPVKNVEEYEELNRMLIFIMSRDQFEKIAKKRQESKSTDPMQMYFELFGRYPSGFNPFGF
jgi:hypothetical protein